jgi:hypothetical protein
MEQGKDIITIDSYGDSCAYQLKTGDINLKIWREILGEVKELIELPIIHPSVDKSKVHKSFLVTNGEITDEVRIQIDQINEDNQRKGRGYSYLDIVNRQLLLKEFIDAQGKFIPKDLKDFRLFLELFLADGSDFLQKDKLFDFLNSTVFNDITLRKTEALNAIFSSVIINAYLLNPYQIKSNYYALFEGWTCLAACIVRFAQKIGLKKEDYINSFDLTMQEIDQNLIMLKNETLKRKDFLEGDWRGDGGFIYSARATVVLGSLATLELYHHRINKEYQQDSELFELIKNNIRILWLWGESAFPYFFSLIKYLELHNEVEISETLLNTLYQGIVTYNSHRSQVGFANPYYSLNDILEVVLGIDKRKIDFRQFSGSSYILGIMILMLAKRNMRSELEKNWQKLSHLRLQEFKPYSIEDIFLWRADHGSNHSEFPTATQSWSVLVGTASDSSRVPKLYLDYEDLLRFFILVCPHRVNKEITLLLDQDK